jgi:hypothetical protein
MRRTASLALIAGSLVLVACGGDDSSSSEESERESATPATAVKEVGETRDALKTALATYKDGDAATAQEQVAEAYVSHFEEVEGPLEDKNEELNEDLEHAISGDLRDSMKAGKPVAAVERQVNDILADLDKAEAALR